MVERVAREGCYGWQWGQDLGWLKLFDGCLREGEERTRLFLTGCVEVGDRVGCS